MLLVGGPLQEWRSNEEDAVDGGRKQTSMKARAEIVFWLELDDNNGKKLLKIQSLVATSSDQSRD